MDKQKETYNGWSNYATWRVNLELIDGTQWSKDEMTFKDIGYLKEYLKDMVEDYLYNQNNGENNTVLDYAMAFVSEVNYHEIAENIIENYPEIITGENTQDKEALTD